MSTFDERQHPRATGGTFTGKVNTAPAGALHRPVDPYGDAPAYPGSHAEQFASAETFDAIDEIWKRLSHASTTYSDKLTIRWSAIERGRQLRRDGASGTPTTLSDNPFAHAQNDAELLDLFELATEEPPGDGEASRSFVHRWQQNITRQYNARRGELLKAGAISGHRTE